MNLNPPGEHELLVFWVSLLVLVLSARLLGRLAVRVGQPAVVGELGAGLLIGPSVLGRLAPDVTDWLFPADDVQTAMLFTVGWIGVLFLLISTGYETDLGLLRRLGRAAALVSTGSLIVPLAAGFAVGLAMPSVFHGQSDDGLVFAMFIGAALSISSLPVIAKILSEMGLMRRNFGQLTLAAGMANDVIGWILLGIIAGVATGGLDAPTVATTVAGVAAFFAAAFTVGQRLIDAGLRRARTTPAPLAAISTLLIAALVAGSITQWLGVEAILGAFVVGILLGRSKFRDDESIHQLETITNSFFAPVFFATAGLRVDLGLLGDPTVFVWAVVLVAAASLSKFVGALIGARAAGLATREGTALGVGLNARGALEIVIATVGLSLGVLNDESYAVVVVMAITTSMMAPPLLRATLRGWVGNPEEQLRLEREALLASNVVVRETRVLMASGGGLNSVMAAQILDLAWPKETPVTLLTATDNGHRPDVDVMYNVFAGRSIDHVISSEPTAEAILAEGRLGAGAIVLGAGDRHIDGHLFTPAVDEVIASAVAPVVVVRRGRNLGTPLPWAYSRALVGVAGTNSSRAAQEIAFNVSANIGTEIVLAHVIRNDAASRHRDAPALRRLAGPVRTAAMDRAQPAGVGRELLDDATSQASRHGARSTSLLVHGDAPAGSLIELSQDHQTDLVVVGATRRNLTDRFFLGHTVEEILARCDATVVVVILPTATDRASGPHP